MAQTKTAESTQETISFEEFTNRHITVLDIEIALINKKHKLIPEIVNSIYPVKSPSFHWSCKHCKDTGDKWYMMWHSCKGIDREKS